MADKSHIPEEFALDIQSRHSCVELAKKYGVSRPTIYAWRRVIAEEKANQPQESLDITTTEQKVIFKLEEENKILKRALGDAKKHLSMNDDIKSLIFKLKDVEILPELSSIPSWVETTSGLKSEIIPVFGLSDTHIGATINPEDVNGVNEYNVSIAEARIMQLTQDFIRIHTFNLSNYSYPGVVVIFGGDMIEQAMHGAEETNELTVVDQVIKATSILIKVLTMLIDAFGKVAVFAVSGNHGRLIADKYVKTANRFDNSLEKIVYHFISVHFASNEDFTLVTSPSDVIHFSINGLRFRLEHGDNIHFTGSAISGPLNSWERGRLKRSGHDSAINKPFDVLIFGHFHQHAIQNKLICLDSTKGMDPYAYSMALPFSLPGCTTFSVNSHGEVIFATNLKCRDSFDSTEKPKGVTIF